MSKHAYTLLGEDPKLSIWLKIDFTKYTILLSLFPLGAFIFCILWSIVYNFQSSTLTQCGQRQPYNVLPSISSAIGGFSPQKEVWKTAITIAFIPRLHVAYIYMEHNWDKFSQKCAALISVAAFLNFVENFALVGLTYFDSTFFYPTHEKSFITFILCSELYMIVMVYLECRHRRKPHNSIEARGLKLKKLMLAANIIGILSATNYFIDHNLRCLDFTYTKFAFCEYIVVLSNVFFHLTVIYDLPESDFVVHSEGVALLVR